MANPLTEEQIEEYKEAFSLFERDGEITVGTVGTLMRALGHNPTEGDLAETINSVIGDAIHEVGDGDPAVDFVDFVGIMALYTTRHQENEILEAFKVFDQYSTEYISAYSPICIPGEETENVLGATATCQDVVMINGSAIQMAPK
jgi:calmodulin